MMNLRWRWADWPFGPIILPFPEHGPEPFKPPHNRMISALTGELRRVDEDRIHVQAGPMLYELLVPAADLTELQARLGETLTLHTLFYLGGDPSRGGNEPTLLGFLGGGFRGVF